MILCSFLVVASMACAQDVPSERLLEAPVWPAVRTQYYDYRRDPSYEIKGAYFKGAFVSAADDDGKGRRRFSLRRRFSIPSRPVAAHLQGMGDAEACFSVNGERCFVFRYSNEPYARNVPECSEVTKWLRIGDNELTIEYSIGIERREGGALAELLVRCEDGQVVRIDTDEKFEASAGDGKWTAVRCSSPPPEAPRLARLVYRDFCNQRKLLGGGPLSASVAAGERTALRYAFDGRMPDGPFQVRIRLMAGKSCFWEEEAEVRASNMARRDDGAWQVDIPFEVPLYIHSGTYTLVVESNSLFCPEENSIGGSLTIEAAKCIPGFENPKVVEMRKVNGYPRLHVDGRPQALLWGGVDAGRRADFKARHSDMPLTAVTIHQYYYQWHPSLGEYDFSWFDRKAELYRRSNPDAYYIWDLTIYPPFDFARKHPEEMSADDKGDITSVGRFSWSFASKRALDEMKQTIERAIVYLENSPYANRIIGYRVNSGVTIEWLGWDAKPGRVKDFSAPNKAAFREYAARHCPELGDPHVPNLVEREALDSEFDILWDQRAHQNAIAYMDYNSWIVAQDILETSGHAKRVLTTLGRKKIVGTYYGYTWFLNCSGHDQRRAHFALQHLLDNNNGAVDFLMSPNSYSDRNLGNTCGEMKPFASIAAAGILPVMEDDTRTHNRKRSLWLDYFQTHTAEQTRNVIARNGAIALCRQSVPYYYALVTGVDLDSPECAEVGRDLRTVMDFRLNRADTRHAEVALVVSERSQTAMPGLHRSVRSGYWSQRYGPDGEIVYRASRPPIYNGEFAGCVQTRFARAGAPVDLLLAEDLKNFAGEYKLYVFYNLLKFDRETLAAVRGLRERGATLVWVYAPGYLNGNSLGSMRELTDMAFEEVPGGGIAAVTMKEDGRLMGPPEAQVAKLFTPVDADVKLGFYASGHLGLAAKKTGKSVSIYSGTWQFDQKFVDRIVRRAGAHVYSDSGDPIEADDSLFVLHARFPGRKTIRLPKRAAAVVDVFGKRVVARDSDVFEFDAKLHSTHLFYFGENGDALLKALTDSMTRKGVVE